MTQGKKVRHIIEAEVLALKAQGMSQLAIAKKLGVHKNTVRAAADPEYAEQRNASRRVERSVSQLMRVEPAVINPVKAEFIHDTRSFTGRALGDPLPGRSALDQKRAGA